MKKTDVFGIMISEFGIAFGTLSTYNNLITGAYFGFFCWILGLTILLFDME